MCRTSASPRTRLPRIRGYSAEITQPNGAYINFHPEKKNIMKGKDINLINLMFIQYYEVSASEKGNTKKEVSKI